MTFVLFLMYSGMEIFPHLQVFLPGKVLYEKISCPPQGICNPNTGITNERRGFWSTYHRKIAGPSLIVQCNDFRIWLILSEPGQPRTSKTSQGGKNKRKLTRSSFNSNSYDLCYHGSKYFCIFQNSETINRRLDNVFTQLQLNLIRIICLCWAAAGGCSLQVKIF